uniref:Uncharacterized protein n=1 Tax=viral metagenome TaxID=1070528 RepID=A0A6H1ZEJ5_9ZZZZ
MSEKFEQFAVVELFGHQIIAGMVSEQMIGGQGFVRVDVPAVDGQEGFTKFYGAGAIYALTPCDEATMLRAVQGLRQQPIEVWKLNLPQLTVRRGDEDGQ